MTTTPKLAQVTPIAGVDRVELIDSGHTVAAYLQTASGEPVALLLPRSAAVALAAQLLSAVGDQAGSPQEEGQLKVSSNQPRRATTPDMR
jgi:hypothetical protein